MLSLRCRVTNHRVAATKADRAPEPMALRKVLKGDKIICLGKNYVEPAKELGDALPEKPVLFLKPFSVAVPVSDQGATTEVALPTDRGSVHYETEVLLRLDDSGEVDAVSIGLDLTLRDLQAQLKKNGHPWETAKVFAGSAVIGPWVLIADFPNYMDAEFSFTLDGNLKQQGKGSEMRMQPNEALQYVKYHFPLCGGDILFTGTPKGVGPLSPGQVGEVIWGDKVQYKVQF